MNQSQNLAIDPQEIADLFIRLAKLLREEKK